jgi:PAS domain S-box-containing protein
MSSAVTLLIIEAVFVYLLVLWTHSLRARAGLGPFYAMLGGVTAVMSWVTDAGVQVEAAGITFMVGSTVFYTALLLGVFVVYVFDGPRSTRIAILTIAGMSILVPVIAAVLHVQMRITGHALLGYVPLPSLRINTASVLATIADLIFLAMAWEFLGRPQLQIKTWLRAFLTLLGVMWLDVLLFATGAFAGTPNYLSIMSGTFLSRLVISTFAGPFLFIYLNWQNRRMGAALENRPVLAILREMAEVRTELDVARQEIERRKRAEEALRESEEQYRLLAETTHDIILLHGMEGRISYINQAGLDLAGYKRSEAMGQPITAFIPAEYLDGIAARRERRAAGNAQAYRYETAFLDRNGRRISVEVNSSPLLRQGKAAEILVVARDITERKRAEDAIRRQNDYLAALQETTLELLSQLDLDTLLQNIVKRASQLMGTTAGYLDLVEPESGHLIPRVGLGLLAESLEHAVQPGEGVAGIAWQTGEPLIVNDYDQWAGRIRDFTPGKLGSVIGVPLLSGNQVLGVLGLAYKPETCQTFGQEAVDLLNQFSRLASIAIDNARLYAAAQQELAERKQADEEIRKLNAELEQRVRERTQQLSEAQEQLVRQERLAVLGQLAGGVGHELRNPLAIIANAVYFLKLIQPDAGGKIEEYLGIIEKETGNAEKIISDLLDFSRIRSVDREPVRVPELVQSVLERYPAPPAVTISVQIGVDLPPAYADPRQMTQVLGNLVVNAYQAMPQGGNLTISANRLKEQVAIAVADTGVGISPGNMPRIFEPLFTTRPRGIGLGLAVCEKLVEANSGQIEVQSELGLGTTFTLCLPIHEARA